MSLSLLWSAPRGLGKSALAVTSLCVGTASLVGCGSTAQQGDDSGTSSGDVDATFLVDSGKSEGGSVGRSDATVAATEQAFVDAWKAQAGTPTQQSDLVETIVAFVRSPLFTRRSSP